VQVDKPLTMMTHSCRIYGLKAVPAMRPVRISVVIEFNMWRHELFIYCQY